MIVEAIDRPVTYRWPGGEIQLQPGKPVDLPEERAQRLLAKASGEVRAVESESRRLAQNRLEPDVGAVVLIRDMAGRQTLALVVDVTVKQGAPSLATGRWFCVVADNTSRWVHQSLIVDTAPACHRCQTVRWWWTEEGQIRCARCYPPVPDWQKAWKNLAALTDGILPDDPHRGLVLTLVHACDESFERGDWPAFQRAAQQVRVVVEGREA